MNLNLGGKSMIVTGGGSNIGRAISLAFAKEGVHLTVAEIDEGQGRKVVAEAQGARRRLGHPRADRRDRWESVQAMVREVEGRAGRVDVW
jgi:NAD(P)-dependent dehydrogenase (short-subunit alcohol dehydrogenase family)